MWCPPPGRWAVLTASSSIGIAEASPAALTRARTVARWRCDEGMSMTADPVLSVEGLSVRFDLDGPSFEVLRGIHFQVEKGRTLCLVGESGCGKSITAMAILGLLPKRA